MTTEQRLDALERQNKLLRTLNDRIGHWTGL